MLFWHHFELLFSLEENDGWMAIGMYDNISFYSVLLGFICTSHLCLVSLSSSMWRACWGFQWPSFWNQESFPGYWWFMGTSSSADAVDGKSWPVLGLGRYHCWACLTYLASLPLSLSCVLWKEGLESGHCLNSHSRPDRKCVCRSESKRTKCWVTQSLLLVLYLCTAAGPHTVYSEQGCEIAEFKGILIK